MARKVSPDSQVSWTNPRCLLSGERFEKVIVANEHIGGDVVDTLLIELDPPVHRELFTLNTCSTLAGLGRSWLWLLMIFCSGIYSQARDFC